MREIIKGQNSCDKNNDNVICYNSGVSDIISPYKGSNDCQEVCHLVSDELYGLNDIYRDIADEIGLENALVIYRMFHGTQVSFPNKLFSKEYTHKAIIAEFNGKNVSQLAQKYNYSERSIWRILKSKKF